MILIACVILVIIVQYSSKALSSILLLLQIYFESGLDKIKYQSTL